MPKNTKQSTALSPEGKYVIFYDGNKRNYFSYEVASGKYRNITQSISTVWTMITDTEYPDYNYVYQVAGWIKGDFGVLIYDQNDIWQLDPTGANPPMNLTNGDGKILNIVFRLTKDPRETTIVKLNEKLLLSAFNLSTKENGFYSIVLGQKRNPTCLTIGPYVYMNQVPNKTQGGTPMLKASKAEAYFVTRESSRESPNFFFTSDFKNFTPLTDIHPEKNTIG